MSAVRWKDAPTRTVDVGGVAFAYRELGTGSDVPVVFRASEPSVPPGEYVYLSCRSTLASEGFAVEDATMWAPDGRVLAVARQTRLAGA